MDAQLRAAEIMGRIIDFFEAVEACSGAALETTRGLLVDELAVSRVEGSRSPHAARRRNDVLTAELACIHAAADAEAGPDGHLLHRPGDAAQVLDRVHRVLDGVTALQDRNQSAEGPKGVDILAFMLRGPEPRSWSRDQQDFARCAVEWMRARIDIPTVEGPGRRGRWSTSARPDRRGRSGTGDATGVILTA